MKIMPYKEIIRPIIVATSILLIAFLLYSSTPIIHIHEEAHCLGATLTGRNCTIDRNYAYVDRLFFRNQGGILIYSGMPYILMTIITSMLFFTKKYWVKKEYSFFFLVILSLFFFQFIINFGGISMQGNDFRNIILSGTFLEQGVMLFIFLDFLIMYCLLVLSSPKINKVFIVGTTER